MVNLRSGNGFPRRLRICKGGEFRAVFQQRISVADDMLIVYGLRNGREVSRLGLSVSRKVGNAVVRNRWKRLVREAFRTGRRKLAVGIDLVVIPRKGAKPDSHEVHASLHRLIGKLDRKLQRGRRTNSHADGK